MKPFCHLIKATYIKGHVLELTFSDHTCSRVDFSQFLTGPVFEPLKDINYFKKFFLDGATVAWPNGADIAPETLYEIACRQCGETSTVSLYS